MPRRLDNILDYRDMHVENRKMSKRGLAPGYHVFFVREFSSGVWRLPRPSRLAFKRIPVCFSAKLQSFPFQGCSFHENCFLSRCDVRRASPKINPQVKIIY